MTAYERTAITDDLHQVCGFRSDYQFITKRKMKEISKAKRNPYVKRTKKQITINIDSEAIAYFKNQSEKSGIPYQTLINLYLCDCATNSRELQLS